MRKYHPSIRFSKVGAIKKPKVVSDRESHKKILEKRIVNYTVKK